jgi:hypothetical protein
MQVGGEALLEAQRTMAERLVEILGESPERGIVKLQAVDWKNGVPIGCEEMQGSLGMWLERAPFSVGMARVESGQECSLLRLAGER